MFGKRNMSASNEASQAAQAAPQASPTGTPQPKPVQAIGTAIKIAGDITGDESLIIEGSVDGTISLPNHTVTIGKSGVISADITAASVLIHGRVKGNIVGAKQVALTASCRVQGNIRAPHIRLEEGGKFKGGIDMEFEKDSNAKPGPAHPDRPPGSKAVAAQPSPAEKPPQTSGKP